MNQLRTLIETAWEDRSLLQTDMTRNAILEVMDHLDKGTLRVAEPLGDYWKVNDWVKKAVVMYFPICQMSTLEVGPFEFHDKIPLKKGYEAKGVRVVPHAIARYGAYIGSS